MSNPSNHQRSVRCRAQSLTRSVRLVVMSLAVVGVAFGVYQLGVEPIEDLPETSLPKIHQELLDGGKSQTQYDGVVVDGLPVKAAGRSGITILDPSTLRKRIHMKFDRLDRADESAKVFRMTNPTITYYMDGGQQAVIRADEAVLSSTEARQFKPRRGVFMGNVRAVIDRSRRTAQWRDAHPELASRPTPQHLLVRMWMEEMEFDLDLGRLEVPGKVRIEANEMTLHGEGLAVSWSEKTGALERLKLDRGDYLTFKGGFGLYSGLSSVGDSENSMEQGDGGDHQPPDLPVAQALPKPVPPADSTLAGIEVDDDVLIIDVPPQTSTSEKSVVSYEIEFDSDVQARDASGQGRLVGDHLRVLVDVAPGFSDGQADGVNESQSAGADGLSPDPSAVAGANEGKVIVTWTGPLEIRTSDDTPDDPRRLRRHLIATGTPVVWDSPDGRATGTHFERHLETGYTELRGNKDYPVLIDANGDTRFEATSSIVWDMERMRAHLQDDVRVIMDGALLEGQAVDAFFRKPEPHSDQRQARQLIEKLVCNQDVRLRSGDDEIQAKHLTLQMALDKHGRNIPRHAHARGDVRVVQGNRVMRADDFMDLTFGELPIDQDGKVLRDAPNVRKLRAEGDVRIIDPPRGWDIAGEKLDCAFDEQQVLLMGHIEGPPGQHAKVKMGEYYIEGQTVTFDDLRQQADVPGPGVARFVLTEDLDGRRSDQPVPVEVRWDEKMTLRGEQDILEFVGDAVVQSKHITLSGDSVRIRLTDVLPEPQVQVAVNDPLNMWFLRPFETDMVQLSTLFGRQHKKSNPTRQRLRKRATYILADGDAQLRSRSEADVDGRLKSISRLIAPQIAFDLDAKVVMVEHAGLLIIEDYPAEDVILADRSQRVPGLFSRAQSDGPSQTLIQWDGGMQYYFAQRVARFEGKDKPVVLRHVSGAHIVMDEIRKQEIRITDEQLARLRESGRGRDTNLNCRELLVQFQQSQSRRGRGGGEMSLGELRQFQAKGDVILDDPEWHITGDRLEYVDDSQLISIYGSDDEKAHVNFLDRKTGRYQSAKCSELHVEMKTSHVDAPGCDYRSGGG